MGVCEERWYSEVTLERYIQTSQQGITKNTITIMYRVQGTMMENYYGDEVQQKKSNLEAPRVTINNKRMTNVQLPGGEVVQGIRRNNDLGHDGAPQAPFEPPQPMRPLRYTPGLKCDPALEAMRPERQMKHQPIQGGDQWKQKLIQTPQTFSGSFADADMQKFRPYPIESPMEDPWFVSRLPDQPVGGAMPYMGGFQGGFAAPYPTDQLSQIKMRNRRFQQSCAMEGMQGGPAPAQMMRGPMMAPPPMMMQPQMTEDMMMMGGMQDELAMIDQDLNMTRRATRPFVPSNDPAFFDLQKQVQLLETMPNQPIRPPRFDVGEFLSTDDLPAPKKLPAKEAKEELQVTKPAPRREVGIADQIAIRSYVLGKSIGKTGGSE